MNDHADRGSGRQDDRRPRRDDQRRPQRDGERRFGDRDARPQRDADRKPLRPGDRGYRPDGAQGDRPARDGDRRPQRDGDRRFGDRDSRPQRDGDRRPQRDGDRRPQRDGLRRFGDRDARPQRDGDRRPQRDGDRRPQRDGDRRPQRDGDRRPQRDGERRFGDRDARPQRDGDRRTQREGDRRPPREGDRRPPRDGERRFGDRDARPQRDGDRRPQRDDDRRPPRDGDRRFNGDRDRRPSRDGERGFGRGDQRRRDDQRTRNQGPEREGARPGRDFAHRGVGSGESVKQVREDELIAPALPDDLVAEDLDIGARAQLKTLTKDNADFVAKHMAMASRLIDDDPQLAHEHALTAARRAGRIGVVRETLAITAYQLGDFALALRELRTYRRITGRDDQLPLMADCERGLGRPEKALELARSVDGSTLETPVRVELAIVKSGARLDLGQPEAALEELRIPELRRDKAFEYSPALFASYAGVLEELGRDDEAAEWFALADRAIDALEAALAPGELESIAITTERIEAEELVDAEEIGVELGAEPAGEPDAAGAVEPEAVEPEAVEPEAVEPDAVEPDAGEPLSAGEPAPHGDALFGDALFGDDLIDHVSEDQDQDAERGGAPR